MVCVVDATIPSAGIPEPLAHAVVTYAAVVPETVD